MKNCNCIPYMPDSNTHFHQLKCNQVIKDNQKNQENFDVVHQIRIWYCYFSVFTLHFSHPVIIL